MALFKRKIKAQILETLKKRGIVLILGPRQSGKTTLAKELVDELGGAYFNCEIAEIRKHFILGKPEALFELVKNEKMAVFDEAQTIENIGKILKVFYDTYPEKKIIATGSSAFDLANKIKEPLTGRAHEYTLFPLSLAEIRTAKKITRELLNELMIYGCYPAVVKALTKKDKETEIRKIATNYLYKDVFTFESIRSPKVFEDLLTHLAFRIGSTVSTHDLANELGVATATVERYIRLLEQAFVIKRIYSFARNYANELKKSYKIYFYDIGVRNALVSMNSDIKERGDKGQLFESLYFSELVKMGALETFPPKLHFWRTRSKLEVDFIEEDGTEIRAHECKWQKSDVSFKIFKKYYPEAETRAVTPDDLL